MSWYFSPLRALLHGSILLQSLDILMIRRVDVLELFPRGMDDFIKDPGRPPSPQSLEHEEARAVNRPDPAADGLSLPIPPGLEYQHLAFSLFHGFLY